MGLAGFPGSAVARPGMFSLGGGSLVGSDCREGGRKPSNPFSFMRPFLGSRRTCWLICLSVVCMRSGKEWRLVCISE